LILQTYLTEDAGSLRAVERYESTWRLNCSDLPPLRMIAAVSRVVPNIGWET